MKFVYFGYDFMLPSVLRLLEDGHELLGIFSFECDNVFNFNVHTKAHAERLDIPFTTGRPLDMDIHAFIEQGVEVFLSAGYPHKIPPIPEQSAYGINFHPSLLPEGRGIMPTPTILMKYPEVSGVTVHKLSNIFDDGDILFQRKIPITPQDDVETLSARIAMIAPDILSMVFKKLPDLWEHASPQPAAKASKFPMPDESMRTLNWNKTVAEIKKTGRAFGRFGCIARFDDKLWAIYNFNGWEEEHKLPIGQIACILSREIIIAAQDGFICLKEYQEL